MKDYDIYNDENITIQFKCLECNTEVSHTLSHIAKPDWEGDTVASSQQIEDECFECKHCHTIYEAETIANIYYGEIKLSLNNTNQEVENFNITYRSNNSSMKKSFQEYFDNYVKTQYGDMKGIAYLDGHNGPSDIKKMIEKCQIDNFNLEEYVVLGFNIYGFEPIGKTIHATVLATQKTTLSIRGNINNLNYDSDVQEFSIKNCSWEFLGTYIKRLSIGFILPDHLRK
jgi:hypothetical protein